VWRHAGGRGGVGVAACDYLYTSDVHCTLPDTRAGGGEELRVGLVYRSIIVGCKPAK